MSNSNNFGSAQAEVFMDHVAIILTVLLLAFFAAAELSVALNMKLTRTVARVVMYAGLLPWVYMAVDGWVDRLKGDRDSFLLFFNLLFSIVAVIAVVGMFAKSLTPFTVWANTALSVVLFIVSLFVCEHTWGDCGVGVQIAECNTVEKARQLYFSSPDESKIKRLAMARWIELAEKQVS